MSNMVLFMHCLSYRFVKDWKFQVCQLRALSNSVTPLNPRISVQIPLSMEIPYRFSIVSVSRCYKVRALFAISVILVNCHCGPKVILKILQNFIYRFKSYRTLIFALLSMGRGIIWENCIFKHFLLKTAARHHKSKMLFKVYRK